MKKDCIYFQNTGKGNLPLLCKYRGSLHSIDEEEDMCRCCRLWDAYIPENSSDKEIEKAQIWQHMPLEEQEKFPYEEYFNKKR